MKKLKKLSKRFTILSSITLSALALTACGGQETVNNAGEQEVNK